MLNIKHIIAATIVATSFSTMAPTTAKAEECGHWAFAGAYQSYRRAKRQANRFGGFVLNLDRSNSPNAGAGYYVVGKGPYGKRRANRKARQYRRRGVRGAYAAHRCFYGS